MKGASIPAQVVKYFCVTTPIMMKYFAVLVIIFGLGLYVAVQDQRPPKKHAQEDEHESEAAISKSAQDDHRQENPENTAGNSLHWYRLFTWPEGITTWAIILTLLAVAEQASESSKATRSARDSVREMQRNIELQKLGMRQWVVLSDWTHSIEERRGDNSILTVKLILTNPTKSPLIFLGFDFTMVTTGNGSANTHTLVPNEPFGISFGTFVTATDIALRDTIGLVKMIFGTITFIDALKDSQTQKFIGLLQMEKEGRTTFTPQASSISDSGATTTVDKSP